MIGVLANTATVIVGSIIGLFLKKGIPERISDALMKCIGLCTTCIAVSGMLDENANILIVIISMALGTLVGELIDIDKLINSAANKVTSAFSKKGDSARLAEGFVSASLLYCVGAMTVVGSLQAGISHNYSILFTKSVLDGIAAVIFASTLGVGAIFSAVSVFVIQGAICLSAVFIAPYLTDFMTANVNVVGSVAILAISLNLIGITKIKVANLVPAVFFPIALCPLYELILSF